MKPPPRLPRTPAKLSDSVRPKLKLYMLAARGRGKEEVMASSRTNSFNAPRCLGIGALVLAIWLTTAIAVPAQTLTTLASFDGADGFYPSNGTPLVQGTDGNFYGTTNYGGDSQYCYLSGCGIVFKITPTGTLTTLHRFCTQEGCLTGYSPDALVQGNDGNFYGLTAWGGSKYMREECCGTLFKITPTGTLTTVHYFCTQNNSCPNGRWPFMLVQGSDGNFYGVTAAGGKTKRRYAPSAGTFFKITPTGTFHKMYNFCSHSYWKGGTLYCVDGEGPYGLIQATDGNFYGITGGGSYGAGTVFRMTPAGKLTTLYSFCSQPNCPDGNDPTGLVQGSDGNFYGTTFTGGNSPSCCGTIFQITTAGTLTTLYRFCSQTNCTDGSTPLWAVVQATDGNFYGTTISGGVNTSACNGYGCGTIFQITSTGTLTTLYSFCSQPNCTDGLNPETPLMQASDGDFYGTTIEGGTGQCLTNGIGCGTVFSFSMGFGSSGSFIRNSGDVGPKVSNVGFRVMK